MGNFRKLAESIGEVKASLLRIEERTDPIVLEKAEELDKVKSALKRLPFTVNSYIVSGNGNLKNAVRVTISYTTDITFDDDLNLHCSDGFKAFNELKLIDLEDAGKIQEKLGLVSEYLSKNK